MGVAIHAPHSPAHLGIKHNPVSCISPFTRYSRSRTLPARAAILAAKQPDVRVCKELSFGIERIEVDAVHVGDIETTARPLSIWHFVEIHSPPASPAVTGLHGSSKIGTVGKVRVLIGNC